ncbi:MAG: type II restriction enzyme [Opitutales bacterium]
MANDNVWKLLLNELDILDTIKREGYADIDASDIKRIVQNAGLRPDEPRILCKMDYRESRPNIFKTNGLSLLAVRNGRYRVARSDPFIDLPTYKSSHSEAIEWTPLATLDPWNITSESKALQVAYVSKMLERVFGERATMTIYGRQRAEAFQFKLNGVEYDVEGVQIEIDGGYEGRDAVHLIEAKNDQQYVDMSYRQIAYPLHQYESKLEGQKQVYAYGMTYEAPYFRFIRYDPALGRFEPDTQRIFHIIGTLPEFGLLSISASPTLVDTSVPFPQADDFSKVLTILDLLSAAGSRGIKSPKEFLSNSFGFEPRQSDYYANALKWMRLATVERSGGSLKPTPRASVISALPINERLKEMAEIVFSCPIFNQALREGISSIDVELVTQAGYRMNATTVDRRMSTVENWIEYFKARFPS